MKNLVYSFVVFGLLSTASVFANEAAPPVSPAPEAPKAEVKTETKTVAKLSHRDAKKACKAENAKLSGKDLKKCIQEKMGH